MDSIYNRLVDTHKFFVSFTGKPSTNGMKLSIQGKTLQHALELYEKLGPFLKQNNVAFKVGTETLINKNHPTQSTKLMTIYVPDDVDFKKFTEVVYRKIKTYQGWYNIKTPPEYEHYAGGVFFRNDRDQHGNYIPATKSRNEGKNMNLKLMNILNEFKTPGNKSGKNVFGDDKTKDINSSPKDCCQDYPLSYDDACEMLKGIKNKEKLDKTFQEAFLQMTVPHERNKFRRYYEEQRAGLKESFSKKK